MRIPPLDDEQRRADGRAGARGGMVRTLLILLLLLGLLAGAVACVEEAEDPATTTAPTEPAEDEATSSEEPGEDEVAEPEESPRGADQGAAGRSPARQVADSLRPSVVQITVGVDETQAGGQGAGVIYSADGLIVTNDHVITAGGNAPAESIRVTLATGRTYEGEVVGRDPRTDLALLQIPATDLPEATFREDLSDLGAGDYAIAIGNPLGFEGSVTMGIVSGIERELQFSNLFTDLIQTDAPISPGNSGGALADDQGRVIGINVAAIAPTTRAQGIGFAIPSDLVITVIEQLSENGRVEYAFLGVQAISVDPFLQQHLEVGADRGVLVGDVGADSPAAQAGLQEGDVIVEFEGEELRGKTDLFRLLREHRPGDEVTLSVQRGGETMSVEVTLGEAPEV
jgi:S1-C subfamily serine protease